MVELFIRRAFLLSAPRREAACSPGPPVAGSETPHASQVERTHLLGPGPLDGIGEASARAPALRHHGLGSLDPRSVPVALLLRQWQTHPTANTPIGSNAGFWPDCHRPALVPSKPPSSTDKRVSPHPAPRVATVARSPLSASVAGPSRFPAQGPSPPRVVAPILRASLRMRVDDVLPDYNTANVGALGKRARNLLNPGLFSTYQPAVTALTAAAPSDRCFFHSSGCKPQPRRGKPIARLVPVEENQAERTGAATSRIRAPRKRLPRTTLEELLSWRHEGHRF
jgi:hypothetical protein